MAIIRHATGADGRVAPPGVATLLVSPSPLSAADVDALEAAARRLRFDVILSPRHPGPAMFETLTSGQDLAALYARVPGEHRAAHRQQPVLLPHRVSP